jgi:hypothetical protein
MIKAMVAIFLGINLLRIPAYADFEGLALMKEKISLQKRELATETINDVEGIKALIQKMYSIDQEVRFACRRDMNKSELQNLIVEMDRYHIIKIKEILREYGWPVISKFGKDVDHQMWLLVQHADQAPFFQAWCLFVLSQLVAKGETDPKNYAYLYDRVSIKLGFFGIKQRYGTQVLLSDDGKVELYPYEGNVDTLNKRRKEVGLGPIEVYLQKLRKVYQ